MRVRIGLVALALGVASQPLPGAAAPPPLPTYGVGSIPVAPGSVALEFPLFPEFRGEVAFLAVSEGTYQNGNPFSYLALVSPSALLHYDGVSNLRLSAGFGEFWYFDVPPTGLPAGHEERFMLRARLQQPLGSSAIYEMVQLDIRSFDLPTGVHEIVYRPRFRVGQGFNLDAVRIHSLVLYEEVAFRFASAPYTTRAFDFFRTFVGYTWTTRRGIFVTAGIVGQISLNPPGTQYTFFYGPMLSFAYRIMPSAQVAEVPPEPSNAEIQ